MDLRASHRPLPSRWATRLGSVIVVDCQKERVELLDTSLLQ